MNLRDLRYFVVIAESGSIMAASEQLHVAQPSLSVRVKELEQELGVPLFDRRPRGVVLTSEGEELLSHARHILQSAELARESIRRHAARATGEVNLGVPTSLSPVLCVPLIERSLQELPNVKLCITESMTGYIVDWLRDGRLDLGLVFSADPISGIRTEPLLVEELYLAAASAERLAPLLGPDGDVPFDRLVGEPLVLPTKRHGLRTIIDHIARQSGIEHTVQIEIDSFPEIQRLVRRDLGLTILSLAALHESEFSVPLHTARIVRPSIRRMVSLAYAEDRLLTKATREVGRLVSHILRLQASADWWRAELA